MIENSIRDLIVTGEVSPGDRLPVERELSKQFGVSIITVREALRGLETFGVIERRRGRGGGIFVADSNGDTVKGVMHNLLASARFASSDLDEIRLIIEPPAVRLAMARMTSHELKLLDENVVHCEKWVSKCRILSERDFFNFEERNVEFHRLIAEATHNSVLALTVDYVMDLLFSFKKTVLTPDMEFAVRCIKEHRAIITYIQRGDQEGAEKEMYSHIKWVQDYLGNLERRRLSPIQDPAPNARLLTKRHEQGNGQPDFTLERQTSGE